MCCFSLRSLLSRGWLSTMLSVRHEHLCAWRSRRALSVSAAPARLRRQKQNMCSLRVPFLPALLCLIRYSGVFNTWLACPGFLAFLGVLNHVLIMLSMLIMLIIMLIMLMIMLSLLLIMLIMLIIKLLIMPS